MAFSLACVQVQVWPTASGAGDMEFGFRRGAQHPELAIWSSGPGMAGPQDAEPATWLRKTRLTSGGAGVGARG